MEFSLVTQVSSSSPAWKVARMSLSSGRPHFMRASVQKDELLVATVLEEGFRKSGLVSTHTSESPAEWSKGPG